MSVKKQHQEPFPSKLNWESHSPLELIHTDICGLIQGNQYFLLFVDDSTIKIWVYFVKEKSETIAYFKEFQVSSCQIKNLRSNRGGEYLSILFENFCQNYGSRHELTARYS